MVGQRLTRVVDREPVWRRVEDRFDQGATRVRNAPGRALKRRLPSFRHRNFGGGLAVGVIEAAIAIILRDTVGIPFGSDVEIVDAEARGGAMIYTVNVDAPFQNMAEAEAFFESGTGFTSLLTDMIDVQSTQIVKHRVLRDTYQIKVRVED